jgi:hypothetical protein
MRRYILAGLVLAVLTTLIVLLSGSLGLDVENVALLGAALGGALGLVPDRSPAQRAGAFGVGFAAAWLGYLLRAAALPDTTAGIAVAVLVVLALCVAVAVATAGRIPLWATLIGAAALVGAYEPVFAADPTTFVSASATSAASVLLAAGAGYLATSLLGPQVAAERERERERERDQQPVDPHAALFGADAAGPVDAPPAPEPAAEAAYAQRDDEPHREGPAPFLNLQPRPEA